MPAPEPSIRASVTASPSGVTVQVSVHAVFSTLWVQDRVKADTARTISFAPSAMQRLTPASAAPARPPVVLAEEECGEGEADLVGDRQRRNEGEGRRGGQHALPQRQRPR